MTIFKKIFGLDESEVQKNCIICPINDFSLFIRKNDRISKGLLFSATNSEKATVISSKNNFLLGDCVLYLKETLCENIFLFGSCASTGALSVGDPVLAEKSFSFESFSDMLKKKNNPELFFPDKELFDKFHSFTKDKSLFPATLATVNSICLETDYLDWSKNNNVKCFDMETSIIFSSAKYIGRKAIALLYVTDIIGKQSFHEPLDENDRAKLLSSRKLISKLLVNFIENELY